MLITITDDMATRRGSAPRSQESTLSSNGIDKRLKYLRLLRPHNGSYGFHLRGGREHGTGFFISHVEPGTEAFLQGLRSGDQVLKVNDLNVNGALHKEVAALVRAGTEVRLHVKSTGLIPVKNNSEDPLSWVLVEPNEVAESSLTDHTGYQSSLSSVGTSRSISSYETPVKIVINGAGKNTLGCSICKGPAEKPGIFVQRVRERGIAQNCGLRAGDQILSCNGVSFRKADFQQAVQTMKSSSCLRLEVLRGAGIDMIAGESSGYNSSASSETGEETFSHCDSHCREGFPQSLSSTLKRLNGISNRIQLDPNRDWKEIEAEWADAEVSEKRSQLETSQTILSRKLNQKTSLSKSFVNLTINEVDEEPTSVRDLPSNANQIPLNLSCNTCCHMNQSPSANQIMNSGLSKTKSMSDLRPSHNDHNNYKIAMQMSSEAHVSKIVIPSAPKNEQNALLRLEELSSGAMKSTVVPPKSQRDIQTHNKTCSLSSTSSDESSHLPLSSTYAHRNLGTSLKESRQLLRCRSVPQDTNSLSEDSDSLLSFPSSTISICKTGSGRFTSKVHIRNSPPPPPPRGNSTKLSRQQRKFKCCHHRKFECPHHPSSPSTSPCTSSSSGDNVSYNDSFARRQSLETISLSSEESLHWEEAERKSRVAIASSSSRDISSILTSPPTAPPLPSSSIPPPPPPPPQQVPSSDTFSSQTLNRQQEIQGATSKLKSRQEEEVVSKRPPPDPKKMQHEKLMEEFKKAHASMVARRQASSSSDQTT